MDYSRGIQVLEEMLGKEEAREVCDAWKEVHPDLEHYIVGFLAGEIWARPGLERKVKSLCTITALAALGRREALALNIRMALKNGARKEEIFEALLHIAPYAGFPAAWESLLMARKVLGSLKD